MKFLLIIPLLAGVIFFVTAITEPDRLDDDEKRERLLTQFGINYKSMMTACSGTLVGSVAGVDRSLGIGQNR